MFPVMTLAPGQCFAAPDVHQPPPPAPPVPAPSVVNPATGSGSPNVKVDGHAVMREGDEAKQTAGPMPPMVGVAGGRAGGAASPMRVNAGWPKVLVNNKKVGFQTVVTSHNNRNMPVGAYVQAGQQHVIVRVTMASDMLRGAGPNPIDDHLDWIECSETMMNQVQALRARGCNFEYGPDREGLYCARDETPPRIRLQDMTRPNPADNPHTRHWRATTAVSGLAHEMGHAVYRPPSIVDVYNNMPPAGPAGPKNASDFMRTAVNEMNVDEGAATLNGAQIRQEMLAKCGVDIGINGPPGATPGYAAIASGPGSFEQKSQQIGDRWRYDSTPSGQTHGRHDNYSRMYSRSAWEFVKSNGGRGGGFFV